MKKPFFEEELAKGLPIIPRYAAAAKRIGLGEIMGGFSSIALSSLSTVPKTDWPNGWPTGPAGEAVRLLIVAFDYDMLREEFLRSYSVEATGATPDNVTLADAVHSSTNAPVIFFDAPALVANSKRRYWDGAMGGYNNPLMAAVIDAVCLGESPNTISILSIGTGTVRLVPYNLAPAGALASLLAPSVSPGIITDAGRAGGCVTDDPPDAATFTAHVLLGNRPNALGRLVRMSPVIQPILRNGAWAYPDGLLTDVFDQLTKLGMDAVEDSDVALLEQLGTAWLTQDFPNQPIRMRDDLTSAIGDPTYAEAKERWLTIVS